VIQQATDMAHSYSWTGPLMWYSYQDRGGSTSDTENWFGLVGPNGEHKQAYATYQNIATHDNGTVTPVPQPEPQPVPVEQPTFTGTSYTGTSGNDIIIGNNLNNTISGNPGNDTIKGGNGNDFLTGHTGNDKLWGGAGTDTFDFNDAKTMGADTIMDFAKGDKIDLAGIDANINLTGNQNFKFIASAWLAKAGDLGFYQDKANSVTHIQGDTNGDGKFDFTIMVQGVHTFTATDFVL
jgi:Ca2+-binding RTX toxin-like protein